MGLTYSCDVYYSLKLGIHFLFTLVPLNRTKEIISTSIRPKQ